MNGKVDRYKRTVGEEFYSTLLWEFGGYGRGSKNICLML